MTLQEFAKQAAKWDRLWTSGKLSDEEAKRVIGEEGVRAARRMRRRMTSGRITIEDGRDIIRQIARSQSRRRKK